jgi:hypothetical protein
MPRDERGLKRVRKLSTSRRESNSAGQSKSTAGKRLPVQDDKRPPAYRHARSDRAAIPVAAARLLQPKIDLFSGDTRKRRRTMKTSSARKLVLGTAIAASMGIGYAVGAQPHMAESIALLQSGRAELAAATPNKGGHRERALGLIDQAIGEVRAGIAFAGG